MTGTARTEPSEMAPLSVPLRWIDDAAPEDLPSGSTLGAPMPRGLYRDVSALSLVTDAEVSVPAQFWSLATWPDGSLKWVGVGLAATETPAPGYRLVDARALVAGPKVLVDERDDEIFIDTGSMTLTVPRSGSDVLIDSLSVDGVEVATAGRLVSSRQTHPEPDHLRRIHAIGVTSSVSVEQDGPLRAVIRVEGAHRDVDREWLPFVVRLIAVAGARSVRIVHSFTWDGDPDADFLSSLGIRFDVPLRAESHDCHVRFTDAEGGVLHEAVRGLTGLRKNPGDPVRHAQTAGEPTPPRSEWLDDVDELSRWVPEWPDYTCRQLSADAYAVAKRTAGDRPWIDVAAGRRSAGYAYLGDTTGGFAVALADFWQSAPTGLDIRNADTDVGEFTVWLWAPDAPPMDLRFYHDGLGQTDYRLQLNGLDITYEDYEDGLGSAHGIARTHELDLYAYGSTPSRERAAADARHTSVRPRLAVTPETLRRMRVFGDWDLVDRTTPARAALEDRLDTIVDFYLSQVDQRNWYGFWNYGDFMHTYDRDRHVWRYDVGGYAWDNSELATDMWLWTTFLRTGRADVFRTAEAMARHTADVDSYHAGDLRGLGTRHNVQHWGCGCKQLRIGSPAFRRHHYFLTADEHSRDRIIELRDSDETFLHLDPSRKARPDEFPPRDPDPRSLPVNLGTDWSVLAATWLADWEITGNERSRERLLNTMADIAGFPHGFLHGHAEYDVTAGRLHDPHPGVTISHLSAIFGLVEICSELLDLVDVPGFREAWLQYCRLYLATPEQQIAETGAALTGNLFPQWHSRLLAFAARTDADPDAARRAWEAFHAGGEVTPIALGHPTRVYPPHVLAPVDELQISTNDAAQSSLATIQNLALIGDHLR